MTTDIRSLPHNLDAERSVLGSILIKPLALDDVTDLDVDDFFLPAHREIFEAMRTLAKRGAGGDIIMLAEELRANDRVKYLPEGESYLLTCANSTPTAENVVNFAKIVSAKSAQRKLIAAAKQIESSAYGDWGDVKELLSESRRALAAIDLPDGADKPELLSFQLDEIMDSIEKRASDPTSYLVTTGFSRLDEKIGGFRGGNLIVVAARPGKGKSAWTLQVLLDNAARGIPVLLFSLEMSKAEITERALAQLGEVNGHAIKTGRLSGPEWMRLTATAAKLNPLPFWLYNKAQKAERICSLTRRWFAKLPKRADGKPIQAIVAIDYIGLIPSSGDEDDRRHEIAAMSRSFKGLAGELDIPIIEVAQLNRELEKEKRRPRLSDLRDAGEIEQDANMVIFPWWDGFAPRTGVHPAAFIIGKGRDGAIGEVDCEWQAEFVRFVDRPFDEEQTQPRLPYND